MKGPDYWFIRLSSYRDVTLDQNATNWMDEPDWNFESRARDPYYCKDSSSSSFQAWCSHLTRAACQLTRMAIAGPSVGDAESCSWAPGVQWQEHVSASTHFLGTRCSLISFNTFPFCLCLPELVSNLQGGTNPILQLKIINQIALLFCAGEF